MEKDNLLTIILPTYNRAELLDKCLKYLAKLQEHNCFNIIICNNGSTDNTADIINKWRGTLQKTQIVNHKKNVLYDRNVASGYELVSTDYCWLLGDSYTIDNENFEKLLKALVEKRPQALIINDVFKVLEIGKRQYSDCNLLLHDLGWFTTLLSSCVISKDFIDDKGVIERYYDTEFVHAGVFYENLSKFDPINVIVDPTIYISAIEGDKMSSSWRKTPFRVFGKGWFAFIMSLPCKYSLENKLFCIKQHDLRRHIFAPKTMFLSKISGYCTFEDYKESRAIVGFITKTSKLFLELLKFIPSQPKLVSFLYHIQKILKR